VSTGVKLSTVLSAMSYALDLTEGQPLGHAGRSCLLGMRLADVVGLPAAERSDLFYALLMKDAGCSSNAARVYQLFGGDDQPAKSAVWRRDWRKWREKIAYALEVAEPDAPIVNRVRRFASLALAGPDAERELFQIRCDRGADIARELGVTEPTAIAIRTMDEHWGIRKDCGASRSLSMRASSDSRRSPRSTGRSAARTRRSTSPAIAGGGGSTPSSCPRSGVSDPAIASGPTFAMRTSRAEWPRPSRKSA
jgi:hypothetical protein